MMRKENRNPNRSQNIKSNASKSYSNATCTPDQNTSRVNFKPKFIKKQVNIQRQVLGNCTEASHAISEAVQQSAQTYLHSPVSMTEHNTIDMDSVGIRNKWKELYNSTRQEMEARTYKFDKSVSMFCLILKGLKKVINDPKMSEQDKLSIADEEIDDLLQAFDNFDIKR